MTDQNTEQRVVVLPVVQVTFGDDDFTFPFADIARGADDPATISDADLITRVANHMDRPVSDFARMQVARPATGNIVVMAKPTYGSDAGLSIFLTILLCIQIALLVYGIR